MRHKGSILSRAWLFGTAFPLVVLGFTYGVDPLGTPERASASIEVDGKEAGGRTPHRLAHPDSEKTLAAILAYEFDASSRNPFRYRDGELYNTSVSVTDSGPVMISSEFQVTSILGGSSPIALINGKAYKKGDEVVNGWRIETIDPAGRTVTLRHPDGRAEHASLDRQPR